MLKGVHVGDARSMQHVRQSLFEIALDRRAACANSLVQLQRIGGEALRERGARLENEEFLR